MVSGGGGDKKSTIPTTVPTPVSVPAGATISGDTPCPAPDGSSPRTTKFAKAPPMCIDPAKTYTADIRTNKGVITVALDAKAAPQTVNNFVVLSRYHYFDGIGFHRIIPGFVVQGGDPLGSGTGGPGYSFADELPPPGQYKEGSLAMANSGPNTNGSQFFIVTGPNGQSLQPNFSLFGHVTGGMQVAKAIEAVGTSEGTPKERVTIDSVTVKES
jgi:cyclophilin family peptidyl-prolyl cis-trans isomerase